ncbi:MAG: RNA 2',3'-cyclic phosphodiesterase [Pseudomonadota bacterium]
MSEAAETVRLFFALWPPGELQGKLADWANQAAGRGRAMRRENIHLTLAFLGDTKASLVPDLIALARDQAFPPLRLSLDRVGYWKHNRIIWCGAEQDPPALTGLVSGLRARLDSGGIACDRKPFVSHMTLVRDAVGLDTAPAWVPLVWDLADFALVTSVRIEGRVTYQVMQRFPALAS